MSRAVLILDALHEAVLEERVGVLLDRTEEERARERRRRVVVVPEHDRAYGPTDFVARSEKRIVRRCRMNVKRQLDARITGNDRDAWGQCVVEATEPRKERKVDIRGRNVDRRDERARVENDGAEVVDEQRAKGKKKSREWRQERQL